MGRAPLPELPIFEPVFDGFRHEAATFSRDSFQQGWYQDGRKLRQVKTSKAFIWPKDGKNGSSWGRLKDVFQNKGPDMYIAFGARSTDCVSNRPSRSQWAGHTQLDDRGMKYTFNSQKFAPWTKSHMLGGREHGLSYDFRTRKHSRPDRWMWTDAIWQQEPYKNRKANNYPEALRTMSGLWWQDTQYLPEYLGGCVDNEFGIGLPFYHLD